MLKSSLTKNLVEKFEKCLKELSVLSEKKDFENALNFIEDTFKNLFRLNSMFFNSLSDENLIEILKAGTEIEKDKAIIIAKLLEEKAKILDIINDSTNSFYVYTKSLNLFLESYSIDSKGEVDYYLKDIPYILEKVSDYPIPKKTLIRVINYHIKCNNFASAEDSLYELLEATNYNKEYVTLANSIYKNLLKKENNILIKGNLPREEILDALDDLKKYNL